MPRPSRSGCYVRGAAEKPAEVAEADSAKLVVELNRAAAKFRSADHAIRSHIDDVVSEHPNDILFLSFEDKRALKLYSCGFRCRHCAITKCGVAVWRARHALGEYCFRYVIPFDWIEDKEDFLVSSLVDTLRKMPRAPSLLVLALPQGCYEAHRPLVLGLAFIMELLKIREVHVYLSPANDSSYHFADLLKQTEEGECRTVQDVAALPLPRDAWRTRVNMPLYNIVDILCTLTTSPIAQPSTTFVLARNADGAVTYRTSAFLPKVMWTELRWSMEMTRMMEGRERVCALEIPAPPYEPIDEPFRPMFASSDEDTMEWAQQGNRIPKRRISSRLAAGGRRVVKRESMEEEEDEEEASSEQFPLSSPRGQRAESDPDSPEVPAKRLRASSVRKLMNAAKLCSLASSKYSMKGGAGMRRVMKEGERARGGMDMEEEEEEGGKEEESDDSDSYSPEVSAKRRRASSGRKSVNAVKASPKSKKAGAGRRRVKEGEERAREGMDMEEEDEEGGNEEKGESEDDEDREPENPHGAVTVFLKNRHSNEQRRAIAAKCRPTLPDVEGRVERLVEELRANGDATEKLIRQWRRMGEKMIPLGKDASLLEALDEISSRMTPISVAHPEWDPEVFFHDK